MEVGTFAQIDLEVSLDIGVDFGFDIDLQVFDFFLLFDCNRPYCLLEAIRSYLAVWTVVDFVLDFNQNFGTDFVTDSLELVYDVALKLEVYIVVVFAC